MRDLIEQVRLSRWIANGPEYALGAALALAGIVLLLFWRSSRGREYLWAAIMLLSPLATAILSSPLLTAHLSFHAQTLALAAVYSAGLRAEIEFMWTLFQLRSRWIHILWHAIWVAFMLAEIAEACSPRHSSISAKSSSSQALPPLTAFSSLSAFARSFGQEDDITVVTLKFAPAEALHA